MSASCRVWGNCEIAAKRALVAAAEEGAAIEFVRLPDLEIDPCRGCFRCLSDARACVLEDDVAGLLAGAAAADALVLAAPVYFGLPPAALVGLLDRLLVAAASEPESCSRPAVTITVMGNGKWRGVAEPFVNLTASLLGFEVVESLAAVAEGPGEVLADAAAMERLAALGSALGSGPAGRPQDVAPGASSVRPFGWNPTPSGLSPTSAPSQREAKSRGRPATGEAPIVGGQRPGWRCRVCGGDFLRIEEGAAICPVCGSAADAAAEGATGPRWGRAWLRRHVADWIKPSIERYKPKRKQVLRELAEIKRLYALREAEAGGSKL